MDEKENIKMTKEELENLLSGVASKAVETRFKELEDASKKFAGDYSKMDKSAKAIEFIKALYRRDMGALKQMSELNGPDGGFVVPEEWAAEVNRIMEDFGLVSKLARRYPMKYDTLHIPRLASSVTATYLGQTDPITDSKPVLEEVVLGVQTLGGITTLSNELLEDANVDLINLLTDLFAEAIAGEIDKQGLVGTGAPFTGILGNANCNILVPSGVLTFANLIASPDYLRDLITQIKPWALQGAAYIMHRTVWAEIQKSKDTGAGVYWLNYTNPLITPAGAQQGYPNAIVGTLWGYPVYLSDKMPSMADTAEDTPLLCFGNLKYLYLGVRKDISVAISDSATTSSGDCFRQNMSAVRCLCRNAIAVGLPKAFAVLKTDVTP